MEESDRGKLRKEVVRSDIVRIQRVGVVVSKGA